MRTTLSAAICGVVALSATGGSAARPQATVMIQRGGGYLYGNLGCVYPSPTSAAPDPVVYCGEWNYKHPVSGSYVFAATTGYLELMRFSSGKLHLVQSLAQPEGGASPHLLARLPPIVKVQGLLRVGYGAQVDFEGLSLLANNLRTANGKGPLAGLLDLDSSGAARDGSHVASWSRTDAGIVKLTKGVGTTPEVSRKQPKRWTPHLDTAEDWIGDALVDEDLTVTSLYHVEHGDVRYPVRETRRAHTLLELARTALARASSEGEASISLDDLDDAIKDDARAIDKIGRLHLAQGRDALEKAGPLKRATLKSISAARKRAARLK